VDTAEKRASCIGIGLPFRLTLPVTNDPTDQGSQQHLCGLYSGILAASAAVLTAYTVYADLTYPPAVPATLTYPKTVSADMTYPPTINGDLD